MANDGKKRTKYQIARSAAAAYCRLGTPASKERFENAAKRYKDDAVKKGNKTASEADKVISSMRKCDKVSGTRKKQTTTAKRKK